MLVTAAAKTKNVTPTFRTSAWERARRATSGRTMMNAIGGSTIHYDGNSPGASLAHGRALVRDWQSIAG